jgi:hypothetical protein
MRSAGSMVVVWVVAQAAWASAPGVVLVAGDCTDPALISAVRDFRGTAERLLGTQLLESEAVLDIVRPRPTRSLQDVERQVDSARSLFYGGQVERALELVERALIELERASPEAKPWALTQQALVLQALIAKALDRPKEMSDAFRRLVRVDASFKLDPDAHPPSAIAALEAVKKELTRARRAQVVVRVEEGPAATVFIDGQALGQTPLKLDLVPGTYRVQLAAAGLVSFPHRLDVPRDTRLGVDLVFEGSVGLQAPLCLSPGADDGAALKLGQLVTAERLIVLRNTAKAGAPTLITGALFELSSGRQARIATVPTEYLGNLAVFLVTGKEQAGLVRDGAAPKPAPESVQAPAAPPVAEAPRPAAPVVDARKPTFQPGQPVSNAGRVASFALLGAAAAAGLAGGVVWGTGGEDRRRLAGLTRLDGTFFSSQTPAGQEALTLMRTVDGNNTATFMLVGGAVGAAVAGVVGLVLFPSADAKVTASPSAGGGTVTLSGRF